MAEIHLGQGNESRANIGRNNYNIEGTRIEVGWKKFVPVQSAEITELPNKQNAVVFLPGWPYSAEALTIAPLCQALANKLNQLTYALDTYTEDGGHPSLLQGAAAQREFLREIGIKDVIVSGHSKGGKQAMELTALIQDEMKVEGLALFDSMGLYSQRLSALIAKFPLERITEFLKQHYPTKDDVTYYKTLEKLSEQEGKKEIKKQIKIAGGIRHYVPKLFTELKEFLDVSPATPEIHVPVIIVHGQRDWLSRPKKVIPHQQKPWGIIPTIREREDFLRNYLFPNSPSVKMVIGKKLGHHGLTTFRPDQTAENVRALLKRSRRARPPEPTV